MLVLALVAAQNVAIFRSIMLKMNVQSIKKLQVATEADSNEQVNLHRRQFPNYDINEKQRKTHRVRVKSDGSVNRSFHVTPTALGSYRGIALRARKRLRLDSTGPYRRTFSERGIQPSTAGGVISAGGELPPNELASIRR